MLSRFDRAGQSEIDSLWSSGWSVTFANVRSIES